MNLRNILIGAASVAAVAAIAGSASAQTSATATAPAAAKLIAPLTMSQTSGNNGLNFGTMTAKDGTVTIAAADSARSSTGNLVLVNSGTQATTPSAASFTIAGEGNQELSVSAADVTLSDGTHSMTAEPAFAGSTHSGSASTGTITLASGAATLKVGGTLTVPTTPTAAAYTGTLSVTVSYN